VSDWLEGLELSDELKANETLKQSPSLEHALNRVVESRSQLSKAIIPPGDDAPEDKRQAFESKIRDMGFVPKGDESAVDKAPDSPDGYEFESFAEDDARKAFLDQQIEAERKALHGQGVGKRTAEKILKARKDAFESNWANMNESATQAAEALKERFGADYAKIMANANKGSEYLGNIVGLTMADGSVVPVESNERFVEMLSQTGANIGEDGTVVSDAPSLPSESAEDLEIEMQILDKKMYQLTEGDPEKAKMANQHFELWRKWAAKTQNDPSILQMSKDEILAAINP